MGAQRPPKALLGQKIKQFWCRRSQNLLPFAPASHWPMPDLGGGEIKEIKPRNPGGQVQHPGPTKSRKLSARETTPSDHRELQSRRQGPPGTTKTSNAPISPLLENFKTTMSHGARTNTETFPIGEDHGGHVDSGPKPPCVPHPPATRGDGCGSQRAQGNLEATCERPSFPMDGLWDKYRSPPLAPTSPKTEPVGFHPPFAQEEDHIPTRSRSHLLSPLFAF